MGQKEEIERADHRLHNDRICNAATGKRWHLPAAGRVGWGNISDNARWSSMPDTSLLHASPYL